MKHLIIGNKNYSSWSLRPWLLMKEKGISFKETKIPLYIEGSEEELLKYSSSGKVPALLDGEITVWDSLSICEYVNEEYPDIGCWPKKKDQRALARSVSHEMHSGFFEIRNTLHMNCRKKIKYSSISIELERDIERVCEIWRMCRASCTEPGGYLFGSFSIADAMYAPVVLRFESYGIEVGDIERKYMDVILANPSLESWVAEGINEEEYIEECEVN